MRTLVKYRGGKSREISEFRRFIPEHYDRYIEPFLGGGAVFFDLEPERAIINDVNEKLMNFYTEVRDSYAQLRAELGELQLIYEENQAIYAREKALHPDDRVENMNEELYYRIRSMFNNQIDREYMEGTIYYFVNKTAYSGMIRYNRQGEYNVPFGRYVHFNTRIITREHSQLLQRAELFNVDYENIFEMVHDEDFMFLDPPYDCVFNDYGNVDMLNGFDEEQHRRLANNFRNLPCRAMMVIGRTALTEELYGDMIRYQYPKTETKETTLRDVIKAPRWRKSEYTMVKDPKVETLKPDLVCIYPVDDEQKDYCFGIYDAKYYCIDYQVKDNKAKISGQPGVGDVTKQYLYQLVFDDFIVKQGYRYVQNMFFCPGETADRDFGWVQMDMLHQIGDKKLENIAVVKLCASEMYDIYLENKTIDEREIGKYIPVVGIQEVESQNFAKRMLAYLTRITNASKMAEKKLEMKAERGKLIYPKQIKRELGAKIIYDAICPVASKAFYRFDPYEKETYGSMVAEDIGDSYVRCGQIADAAIEIEKIIKDLSEQELQDEKVVKVILKKCFENKEDIGSMAEGMCLEMLTEKVMELVRDLYL